MDNNGSKCGVGNVEEEGRQRIESQKHDDGGDDTSKRRADAGLGLDSSTREGSSRGIRAQKGTQQVGDANGNKFLGRVDDVVVDSAKRLGDGNVLNQHDDDGCGKLRRKGLDNGRVDFGSACVLEACSSFLVRENESSEKKKETSIDSLHTSRHLAKDADWGFRLVVQNHARADTRIQKDHKGCSKGRDEKVHLGLVRLLLGHVRAKASDEIQHQERSQS